MSDTIRVDGADLVAYQTIVDSAGNAVNAGQVVLFSIFDFVTGMYWDNATGAFDSAGEILNNAGLIEKGEYEYRLIGGWVAPSTIFRVGIKLTGIVERDPGFSVIENLSNYVNDPVGVVPIGVVDANLVQVNGQADADGVSFVKSFQLGNAMINGRFKKDFPAPGDITFYERDNITVLTVIHLTTQERTRVL